MIREMTREELARRIDHTLLKPEATARQIDQLCDEAIEHGFWSVCVNSFWVARCTARIAQRESSIVCSVVGFPLGAAASEAKESEARLAVENGALEIDMVVNLGALIGSDATAVARDIATVASATKRVNPSALVKVILETRALSTEQIILGCRCAIDGGADFVKTSTGFHAAGGATIEHVRLLRQHAGRLRVKASGGIRDLPAALAMIDAGADRLGLSAGVTLMQSFAPGEASSAPGAPGTDY
jgi:deoxyribose-phosphate aldolase